MRVLLASDWMSNEGGAERYIVALRDSLRASGDDAVLVACADHSVSCSPSDFRVYGSDRMAAQTFLQISNPFAASQLADVARQFRPDVALISQFAYHFSPSVFQALRGTPIVVSMMDYKAICPLGTRLLPDGSMCSVKAGIVCRTNRCVGFAHWVRDQPRYSLMRRAIAGADCAVCPSEWMRRELAANGISARLEPFGVPLPDAALDRNPTESPTFAYCGRLTGEKGVVLLLRAFARLLVETPSARLQLVGDGPLRGDVEREIGRLGICSAVALTGWLDSNGVEREMLKAWAVVAPSLWAEPFGLSTVEAMVRGVPVVVSGSGGLKENVDPGVTGLHFTSGDEADLLSRLRDIVSRTIFPSLSIAEPAIENARRRFDLTAHAARMRSIFRELGPHAVQ